MTETSTPLPPPPDIDRRTLTTFGYVAAVVVPVLIAAVGILALAINYDPDDLVTGKRVPIMTSDWRPGDEASTTPVAGELELGDDGCVHVLAADGAQVEPVWPADYEATIAGGQLRLYDTERHVVARGGDQIRVGGEVGDVGSYAGRPCAPDSGNVVFVRSEVVVTGH